MKIIFMGTSKFGIPILKNLINSNDYEVVSVFTTEIIQSKGQKLKSPIHYLALQHNIPIYTPKTLNTEEMINLINSISASVIIVVSYGLLLPKAILNSKKYGCINIHPSNLPRHRGPSPLHRTIIEGYQDTAVCAIQMDENWDTGDIILKHSFSLSSKITLPILHDKCAKIGSELIIKVLKNIDNLPRIPQKTEGISYAHKIYAKEKKINWSETSYKIDCRIRGMNPYPGIYFEYKNKKIKILELYCNEQNITYTHPGIVVNDYPLEISCGQGSVIITKLQQESKKILDTKKFICGTKITRGIIL